LPRYKAQGTKPKKYFPVENMRRILEEGCLKGIQQVCNACRINPTTYYYWKARCAVQLSRREEKKCFYRETSVNE
jgi:hypothetical protein